MGDARFSLEAVDDATAVITAEGELDLSNAGALEDSVERALAGGHRRLLVDLGGVAHMDSTATAKLIAAHQSAAAAGGALVLIVADGVVRRTLEVRGLDGLFTVASSRDEALRVVRGEAA